MIQSTSVRNSMRLRFSDVMPIPRTVLADEVSGVIAGTMPFGSCVGRAARRSLTTCRLR